MNKGELQFLTQGILLCFALLVILGPSRKLLVRINMFWDYVQQLGGWKGYLNIFKIFQENLPRIVP